MKKLLLLFSSVALITTGSQAQQVVKLANETVKSVSPHGQIITALGHKSTAVGDTLIEADGMGDQFNYDSSISYSFGTAADSGYVFGMNAYGFKGYAERFDFSAADSSVQVIGAYVMFHGTYLPSSTKTINLKVWSAGAPLQWPLSTDPNYKLNGYPNAVLASQTVAIQNLGINVAAASGTPGALDSIAAIAFSTPAPLTDTFFIGYDINYNWSSLGGDTIGIRSTTNGHVYHNLVYSGSGTDTMLNVTNAIQYSDGNWHSTFWESFYNTSTNSSLGVYLLIAPIFVVHGPLSVHGITKNNLTFFGNYPNPAINSTNIKYALKSGTNVTISVMDMAGHVINTIPQPAQAAGDHIVNLQTNNMAAGNYIYMIKTSENEAMCGKFTVIK